MTAQAWSKKEELSSMAMAMAMPRTRIHVAGPHVSRKKGSRTPNGILYFLTLKHSLTVVTQLLDRKSDTSR
jgi:hypothetical protein